MCDAADVGKRYWNRHGKGVVLGVVCTVLVLPSLLMAFDPWIEKWSHPVLIRPLKRTPKFVVKHYKAILIVFVLLFIPAIYCQANVGQYYDLTQTLPEDLPSVIGTNQLKEKFNMTTTHFTILSDQVKTKDIQKIIDRIEKVDGVTNVIGYEKYMGPGVRVLLNRRLCKIYCIMVASVCW